MAPPQLIFLLVSREEIHFPPRIHHVVLYHISVFPLFSNSTYDLDVIKIEVSALREKTFEKWL